MWRGEQARFDGVERGKPRLHHVVSAMNILVDGTVFEQPHTGIAKAAIGLYRACTSLDPSVRVEFMHRRLLHGSLPDGVSGVRMWSVLPPPLWRRLALPVKAWKRRPAVVHFPWNGVVPRLPGEATVVTTLHDVLPLEIPGYFTSADAEASYRRSKQRDIQRTHLLITDSEYSKRAIMSQFEVTREPVVIHLASSLPAGAPGGGQAEGKYFLYVGGYDPRKGLDALIKCFLALWRGKRLAGRLVLIGERRYHSEAFRRLVSEGVAAGGVEELGYVPDADMAARYSGATALLYPSKYEGFGLPPLEAMTQGCPVLITRCSSLPEICGDAASYVDPDNEQDLAEALIALDTNVDLRRQLREKGKAQAARFSWDRSARVYLNALEETVRHRNDAVRT